MKPEEIRRLAEAQQETVIALRRELHRNPELSSREWETRKRILRELDSLGVPWEPAEGTSVIAVIRGSRPGKARLIRADMDALPLQEDGRNLRGEKVCVSGRPGICHACGHDAHVAMLLGTVRLLSALREELQGTVYCCFEEGEEETSGVDSMMRALEKHPIDECFALHVYAGLDAGRIDLSPGPRMAGTLRIDLDVLGRSGHGSRPDQAMNPVVPAAHIITQLDSAFVNELSPEEGTTLSLCMLRAGEAYNVIPDRVHLSGSARFFDPEEGRKALEIVRRVAENTAAAHRCAVRYGDQHRISLDPVVNDPGVTARVRTAVAGMMGAEALGECGRWYASESYCRYLERWPGAMGFLGIRNPAAGTGAPHHSPQFDVDESVLLLGVCAQTAFALEEQEGRKVGR